MAWTRRSVLSASAALLALAIPATRAAQSAATDPRLAQKWVCRGDQCRPYIYDPLQGDPDSGIPPGTAFEDLPDDWYCPICGDGKEVFVELTPALEKAIIFRW